MGRLITLIFFIALLSCSKHEKFSDLNALDYMKATQNEDGSWGDKNKVYCTSLAVLTFFSSSECIGSVEYGQSVKKGMQYLLDVEKITSKEDLDLYIWSLSESYNFTGLEIIAKTLKPRRLEFKKNLSWDYINSPEMFFIQVQTLHAYRSAGIDEDNFTPFLKKLQAINDNDSLVITIVNVNGE